MISGIYWESKNIFSIDEENTTEYTKGIWHCGSDKYEQT